MRPRAEDESIQTSMSSGVNSRWQAYVLRVKGRWHTCRYHYGSTLEKSSGVNGSLYKQGGCKPRNGNLGCLRREHSRRYHRISAVTRARWSSSFKKLRVHPRSRLEDVSQRCLAAPDTAIYSAPIYSLRCSSIGTPSSVFKRGKAVVDAE